ncbi:CUE domain-containing protein 2 [Stylophora pistillata]|uniref:CUE domain-containing protein 2 n=1 Tax=Stylophora pistillata TaxID=50429 RepID=A0A2B4SGW7_STYPI|nr:CUE domain-containing protein 2 [Stylophora pistillata]
MEETVRDGLIQFLEQKVPAETLNCVDDIVLCYIVNVLEQLGEDEEFDVDEFAEIMAAYIPGFDAVNRDAVQSWMLDLADKLVKTRTSRNACSISTAFPKDAYTVTREDNHHRSLASLEAESVQSSDLAKDHQIITSLGHSSSDEQGVNSPLVESTKVQPFSKNGCNQDFKAEKNIELKENAGNASLSEEISMLTEMFPEACSLELQNCLMVANGDVESAVQVMLLKKEDIDKEWKENIHQTVDHVSPKVSFFVCQISQI